MTPHGKWLLDRRRRKDNIQMVVKKTDCYYSDSMEVTQDLIRWPIYIRTIEFRIITLCTKQDFLTISENSGITQFRFIKATFCRALIHA
jgi:hypothetical protein